MLAEWEHVPAGVLGEAAWGLGSCFRGACFFPWEAAESVCSTARVLTLCILGNQVTCRN